MGKLKEYMQSLSEDGLYGIDHEDNPSELLRRLRLLKEDVEEGIYPTAGICYAVQWSSREPEQLLECWDHYTGDPIYPVPHPHLNPNDGYHYTRGDRWEGAYGDMRKSLLNHLINELEVYCDAIA